MSWLQSRKHLTFNACGRSSDLSFLNAFPLHKSNSGKECLRLKGHTAAGTVGDSHTIPFHPSRAGEPFAALKYEILNT